MLLIGRQSGLVAHLSTGVPKDPGTRFETGGNVASLLRGSGQLGLVDVQILGQLLLAKPVPSSLEVSGRPV
jgi:hypothetical protein